MPVTTYLWDVANDSYLMEKDGDGNTTAVYTQEPGPFGGLISERRDGESHFYHYDALGSTRALTDSAAQTTDSYTYAAYGSTVQASGATFVPYHFVGRPGYYHDQELATYYVRARHYDPRLGRWYSRDPAAFESDLVNLYEYGYSDPVSSIDPSGAIVVTPPGHGQQHTGRRSCRDLAVKEWDFRLSNRALREGFIVQRVTVSCNRFPCRGNGCCDLRRDDRAQFTYFEAWYVGQNQTTPAARKSSARYTDRAAFSVENDYCGRYSQETEIRFYYMKGPDGTGDLSRTWATQVVHRMMHWCRTSSANLLTWEPTAETTEPRFWRQPSVDPPARRSFRVYWHCCVRSPTRSNFIRVS